MAVSLTSGAISMLSSGECQTVDLKPVLQVMDLRIVQKHIPGGGGKKKERFRVTISDGSSLLQGMIATHLNDLVRSQQLQKGSIIRLTEFVCTTIRDRLLIIVVDVNVILGKCDIIGDPKPIIHVKKTPSYPKEAHGDPVLNGVVHEGHHVQEPVASTQSKSKKQKGEFSINPNNLIVADDISNYVRMMMEKNKEDDVGACIEKLEKLGWGTHDPMYDTAILLFGESVDYRKLWLHLKPESCGKWIRNAGSKYGLLVD